MWRYTTFNLLYALVNITKLIASKTIYRNNLNICFPEFERIFPVLSNKASSMSLYEGRSFNAPMAATDGLDVSILSAASNDISIHFYIMLSVFCPSQD